LIFSIGFCEKPDHVVLEDPGVLYGHLYLCDDYEAIFAYTAHWSREDYERQWRDALRNLVAGQSPQMLVTSIAPPDSEAFSNYWPMWIVDDDVVFHQHMAERSYLGMTDDFEPTVIVGEYDPNRKCSEWRVPFDIVKAYVDGLAETHK